METYNTGYIPNLSERIGSDSRAATPTSFQTIMELCPKEGLQTYTCSAFLQNATWFHLQFSFQPFVSDSKGDHWAYVGLQAPGLTKYLFGNYSNLTKLPNYSEMIIKDRNFALVAPDDATYPQPFSYEMFPIYEHQGVRSLIIEQYDPIEI